MTPRVRKTIFCMAFFTSFACFAGTYVEAEKKSEGASSNPALVEWYETKMQPAFRVVVGQGMGQCLSQPDLERPPRVDVVFVVASSGKVGAIYWKEQSTFATCLEKSIRSATFPSPPNSEFYFGVGFRIPAKRTGQ